MKPDYVTIDLHFENLKLWLLPLKWLSEKKPSNLLIHTLEVIRETIAVSSHICDFLH